MIGCRCCDVIGPGLWPTEPNPMEVPVLPLRSEQQEALEKLIREAQAAFNRGQHSFDEWASGQDRPDEDPPNIERGYN